MVGDAIAFAASPCDILGDADPLRRLPSTTSFELEPERRIGVDKESERMSTHGGGAPELCGICARGDRGGSRHPMFCRLDGAVRREREKRSRVQNEGRSLTGGLVTAGLFTGDSLPSS